MLGPACAFSFDAGQQFPSSSTRTEMVGSGIDGCLGLKDSAKGEIGTFSGRLMNRPSETSSSFETPGVITFGVPFAAVR